MKEVPFAFTTKEAGFGFPLMLLPGGGLNSTIAFFTGNSPFNAIGEFKGEYRCITADLRNAPSGQSTGPAEVDRPWESYGRNPRSESLWRCAGFTPSSRHTGRLGPAWRACFSPREALASLPSQRDSSPAD